MKQGYSGRIVGEIGRKRGSVVGDSRSLIKKSTGEKAEREWRDGRGGEPKARLGGLGPAHFSFGGRSVTGVPQKVEHCTCLCTWSAVTLGLSEPTGHRASGYSAPNA